MTSYAKHAAFLFLALRAGDLVNLAAGMWLVPKFVAPEALGAVLPVTTFATIIALPVFAFGMSVMSFHPPLQAWRGVFATLGILTALSLTANVLLLPRYLARTLGEQSPTIAFFVFSAALLGAVAPVYTDALQSVKRFRALAGIEIASSLVRLAGLALLMPLRAFAGYFAGNALQPLVRIVASVFALRKDLVRPSEHWWTRDNTRALLIRFGLVFIYLVAPMVVADIEQDLVRSALPTGDSAAYYIVTRLSDLMNYLTLPLLIVLFPYATDRARAGKSTLPLVAKTSAVTLFAALIMGIVYAVWGRFILSLMPNGENYAEHLVHLPILLAITALTACQTFYTNAEVAAGRFRFLWWFVPMNFLYQSILLMANDPHITGQKTTLNKLLVWFLAGAILRFACPIIAESCRRMCAGRVRT